MELHSKLTDDLWVMLDVFSEASDDAWLVVDPETIPQHSKQISIHILLLFDRYGLKFGYVSALQCLLLLLLHTSLSLIESDQIFQFFQLAHFTPMKST